MMITALYLVFIYGGFSTEVFITPDFIIQKQEEIPYDNEGNKIDQETAGYSYSILHRGKMECFISIPSKDFINQFQVTDSSIGGWSAISPEALKNKDFPKLLGEEVLSLGKDVLYGEEVEFFDVIRHYTYSKGDFDDIYRVAKAPFPQLFKDYQISEKELYVLFAGTKSFTQSNLIENGMYEPMVGRVNVDNEVSFIDRKIVSMEEKEIDLSTFDDLFKAAGWKD